MTSFDGALAGYDESPSLENGLLLRATLIRAAVALWTLADTSVHETVGNGPR